MNKFYIQIFFFLLSITLYVKNETLAAEATSGEDTEPEPEKRCLTSEEIYEKNKDLLCTNSEETKEAMNFMNEAVTNLKYYATNDIDYKICRNRYDSRMDVYKTKNKEHPKVKKIYYTVYDPDKYNETINELWDPNHANPFNNGDVKITRVYNPNLVMIQQRYKKDFLGRQKYFYALVSKAEISEGGTIIVMASANINDHNPSKKVYQNTIIKKANSFKTDINSEDDIKKGKLTKTFVNIAGYLIEKRDWRVDIAYVESIDGYDSFKQK
ncbi:fam-a protein [Plasmodium vinckei brucechwatti]|uniref:Fam-a protein n=1 Tax=Plasmodium vinckei brucechwatti TaxID=119398 RepID=A0A6V7S0D1_PLAVN|nr:fam-a protein [Plasmodium vinckei brucechwatti]